VALLGEEREIIGNMAKTIANSIIINIIGWQYSINGGGAMLISAFS